MPGVKRRAYRFSAFAARLSWYIRSSFSPQRVGSCMSLSPLEVPRGELFGAIITGVIAGLIGLAAYFGLQPAAFAQLRDHSGQAVSTFTPARCYLRHS